MSSISAMRIVAEAHLNSCNMRTWIVSAMNHLGFPVQGKDEMPLTSLGVVREIKQKFLHSRFGFSFFFPTWSTLEGYKVYKNS